MFGSALDAGTWAAAVLIWLAALIAPGPDFFLLLRLAARARRPALLAVLGIMTGNTIWVFLSVFGLGGPVSVFPLATSLFQAAGALVLLALGLQAIAGGVGGLRGAVASVAEPHWRRAYLLGLLTNLSNPKALVFFTAMVTQVFPPYIEMPDRLLTIGMIVSIGFAWFLPIAFAASMAGVRAALRRAAPWLDIAGGSVFILVGMGMLAQLAGGIMPPA